MFPAGTRVTAVFRTVRPSWFFVPGRDLAAAAALFLQTDRPEKRKKRKITLPPPLHCSQKVTGEKTEKTKNGGGCLSRFPLRGAPFFPREKNEKSRMRLGGVPPTSCKINATTVRNPGPPNILEERTFSFCNEKKTKIRV